MAPDAEIDMYDSYDPEDEDVEWKNWLASLYKTDGELNVECDQFVTDGHFQKRQV